MFCDTWLERLSSFVSKFKRTRNKKFDLDLISNLTSFGLRIAKNLSFKNLWDKILYREVYRY